MTPKPTPTGSPSLKLDPKMVEAAIPLVHDAIVQSGNGWTPDFEKDAAETILQAALAHDPVREAARNEIAYLRMKAERVRASNSPQFADELERQALLLEQALEGEPDG